MNLTEYGDEEIFRDCEMAERPDPGVVFGRENDRTGAIQTYVYETNFMDYRNTVKLMANIYKRTISAVGLEVSEIFEFHNGNFGNPNIYISNVDGLYDMPLCNVYAEMIYKGVSYRVKFINYYDMYSSHKDRFFIEFIYNSEAEVELKLGNILTALAYVKTASYKDSVVAISEKKYNGGPIEIEPLKKLEEVKLADVFLPVKTMEQIEQFIYCYKNYKSTGICLRYLFSGDPGVGKTEAMRAIINACKGTGNISVVKTVTDFSSIFEFVSSFEQALLCIDDIDLLLGNRTNYAHSEELKGFLEALDGVEKNNVFIISTTNDKKLVDMAATRPGRFSAIIDFKNIEKKHYRNLISKVTCDEAILGLMTENVMNRFSAKGVSGSFIVNFVKNLKVMSSWKGSVTENDVLEYFDISFNGFYRNAERNNKIGFEN